MHPVIARELRLAARKHGLLRGRFLVAAVACGVTAFFMLLSLIDPRGWGLHLEHWLFYGALAITLPQALERSVGLFTEERSSQNLGLLYLTGMSSFELFGSKLLGGLLVASSQLLAAVPFFAIPFLSGGVSHDLFLASICSLPALLLLTVAIGVLASVLCRDEGAAMITALAIASVLCGATTLPYMLGKALIGSAPFAQHWLWLSPAFGPYAVGTDLRGVAVHAFWMNWLMTLAWAVLCLGIAAIVLRRAWQEDPNRAPVRRWRSLLDWFSRSQPEERAARRSQLLTENPFQWLTQLNGRPVMHGSLFVAGVVLLWLGGWAAWPRVWPSTANFFLTAFVLISGLNWLAKQATARRFAEERRSGTLELLLTTPLLPEDIIDGHSAGIRAQFRVLRRVVLGLCVLMMLGGFLTRPWTLPAVISYLLIWTVLLVMCNHSTGPSLSAAWIALNTGRPMYAMYRAGGGRGPSFWLLLNLYNLRNFGKFFGASTRQFPSGSNGELLLIGGVFALISIVYAATRWAPKGGEWRRIIIRHLRTVAQQPIPDPHDPRLKKWNWKEPLPPALDCDPLKPAA